MNFQPWAFTVVTNQEVMRRLNAIVVGDPPESRAQQHMTNVRMKEIVNDPGYYIFYGAPALVVISGDTKVPGAMFDCQLAAENLFLAAHAKGLGTCYMGFLTWLPNIPRRGTCWASPRGTR